MRPSAQHGSSQQQGSNGRRSQSSASSTMRACTCAGRFFFAGASIWHASFWCLQASMPRQPEADPCAVTLPIAQLAAPQACSPERRARSPTADAGLIAAPSRQSSRM
jgi:hypothetical protein